MEEFLKHFGDLAQTGVLGTVVTALVILLVTYVASKVFIAALARMLTHDNSPLPASSIFINIARVGIWGCGLSILLSTCFHFDLTAAVAALGIGGLAISLGCQDTISNLVGGLQASLAGTVKPGDFVEIVGRRGVVRDVTWRYTTLDTLGGETVIIPNSVINASALMHMPSATSVKIPLYIANSVKDLNETSNNILEAVKAQVDAVVVGENTPRIVFTGTTEFSFSAVLTVDIHDEYEYITARDQAIRAAAPFATPAETAN